MTEPLKLTHAESLIYAAAYVQHNGEYPDEAAHEKVLKFREQVERYKRDRDYAGLGPGAFMLAFAGVGEGPKACIKCGGFARKHGYCVGCGERA